MIRYVQGDLLSADVEGLVNTVNCVGIMGKGLALGGLNWLDVKPLIEEAFSTLPEVDVLLYEPH